MLLCSETHCSLQRDENNLQRYQRKAVRTSKEMGTTIYGKRSMDHLAKTRAAQG
jgi:hypothetical protein